MSHAQQILENRIIFRFNVVELQCNQVERELGAPPEIPVIFGAYVYIEKMIKKTAQIGKFFDDIF